MPRKPSQPGLYGTLCPGPGTLASPKTASLASKNAGKALSSPPIQGHLENVGLPQQNAIVRADPWSFGECRLKTNLRSRPQIRHLPWRLYADLRWHH